jgi:predicted HTH domain antitoxin
MKGLTIYLPENTGISPKEALTAMAAKLYELKKLSLGQAAEVAGYSKRAFIEVLGDYGVSIFNFSPDDLDSDIENAKNYHR